MKKLIISALVITILTISGIAFYTSCEKEKNNEHRFNKSMGIPTGLLQETVIQNMISYLSSLNINLHTNGVLMFESVDDLNKTLEILAVTDSLFDKDSLYCDESVLCAFEYYYSFSSLRASIEEDIINLENNDALFENNDPDDHYIVNNYMRSLLSPQCVVMIANTYYIFYSDYIIGIMNNDWKSVENVLNTNGNEEDLLLLCNENPNIFYTDAYTKERCVANFSYTRSANNPNQFTFTNLSFSSDYQNMTYLWEFGDGNISTNANPIHIFANGFDTSTVTLTVFFEGQSYIKSKGINGFCNADFTFQNGQDGNVAFTSTSIPENGDEINNYSWNFGDQHTVSGSDKKSVTHQYNHNGQYVVRLTITTKNGCSDEICYNVEVTNKTCCKANDHRKITITVGTNRKIKSHARVSNGLWLIHRLDAKTVYYKVKNNGSLKRKKADRIGAGWKGNIYNSGGANDCGSICPVDIGNSKKNRKYYIFGDVCQIGHDMISVLPSSLTSTYYLYDHSDNVNKNGYGANIHQKSCN